MKRKSRHCLGATHRIQGGSMPPPGGPEMAPVGTGTSERLLASAARLLLTGLAIITCSGPAAAIDADWMLRGGSTEDPLILAAGLEPARSVDRVAGSNEERAALAKAPAPTPRAPKPLVRYHVYDQSVQDALQTLGKLNGVPIILQSSIEGRLRAETLAGSLGSIVAELSGRFGFFYAFDGSRFIVSSRENTITDVTEVPTASFDEAVSLVGRVFPAVSPGSVRVSRDLGVVTLRGPEAFVDAGRSALSFSKVERVKIIRGGYSSIVKLGGEDPGLPASK